jgi:hypothetical protein
MTQLKILASTIATMALALLALTAPASATILTDGVGNQLKTGTFVTAESEGTTEQHPPFGSINCKKSHFAGKTSNDGGAGASVNINVEAFSWSECNATFVTLQKGTLSINWTSGNNGTLVSSGTEWTTTFLGFHCIYKTNNTKFGTITGGTPATLDIEATLPRTGGSSGAFCGSTAQWTGSYKFTSPSTMLID